MSTLTQAKIALALIGLIVFGMGVRLERSEMRWIGIAFVVVAWVLRFVRPRNPTQSIDNPE